MMPRATSLRRTPQYLGYAHEVLTSSFLSIPHEDLAFFALTDFVEIMAKTAGSNDGQQDTLRALREIEAHHEQRTVETRTLNLRLARLIRTAN
jgi:hypothetical protein